MEIIPNLKLVLLQMVPFLVAMFALQKIIYNPMLDYLQSRKAAMRDGHDEAARIESEITDRMSEYDKRLADAREKVSQLRAERREAAQAEYDKVVAAARKDAETQIGAALVEIKEAANKARSELSQTSEALAGQISDQVLGRPVAG